MACAYGNPACWRERPSSATKRVGSIMILPAPHSGFAVWQPSTFHADISLAAVRAEHQAFYRRAFNYRLLCEPRPYPMLAKPICLMAVQYPAGAEIVQRRLPFLRSTYAERRALFARNPGAGSPGADLSD
jgi:hypothetical protein